MSKQYEFKISTQSRTIMILMAVGAGWFSYCCLKGVANMVNSGAHGRTG